MTIERPRYNLLARGAFEGPLQRLCLEQESAWCPSLGWQAAS